MPQRSRPTNLQGLRDSGWISKTVKQELRDNFLVALAAGESLFPGIVGYENTVIPEINIALIAGHDMLFLGEKGQGKSRLMRTLSRFLDDAIPYISHPEAPLHDDPYNPITRVCRDLVANVPASEVPIAWWPREERYVERLAPGTKFADIIGEIDPAKLAGGTSMSAEEALHFGLIPRMHRGIFAMNELPELDELVQVGMFNILEERDVQIRGFPVRFDIDVLILFSANPATYNRSGKVIPQLKDRIGSVIHTHYPEDRDLGIEIMEQETGINLGEPFPVIVPRFMKEIIEELSFVARKSKYIDQQSGVSARFSIANYGTMIASARQRGARLGERPAVPRISDLGHLYSSSLGKLELDLMGSHQMSERQILDSLIAEAICNVFDEYVDKHGMDEISQIFGQGVKIEVGDMLPSSHYSDRLKRVPPAWDKAFEVNASSDPAVRASCVEFVLAGLYAKEKICAASHVVKSGTRSDLKAVTMSSTQLGGVIHTYQRYDPTNIPSPSLPPPDLVSPAFEHMLEFGNMRELTDEELARAVKLDIRQIAGFGPSLESLKRMLLERKQKILSTWGTKKVVEEARRSFAKLAHNTHPPEELKSAFQQAVNEEQIRDLERLWYRTGDDRSRFARQIVQLVDRLGDKYQVDELASKYEFTGRKPMTIDQALEVKEELETIERLLKQLDEAAKTAQIGLIDLSELSEFADAEQLDELSQLQRRVAEMVRQMAEQQGLEKTKKGYQLTPQAYRIFQGKLLEQIFSQLQESRTGRHQGPIQGEGAIELPVTKEYEFGDSVSQMDIPQSLVNAMIRGGSKPLRMRPEDIVIHRTRNNPKCATAVLMDMSGSMRHGGQYINVKRMALALDGLIRKEYPGDFLQFIEMASFAKPRHFSEVASLLPKVVTIFDPVVRLRADMSREDISESDIPPHFTNIQHALQLGRQYLSTRDTPNRQIVLITDGLPTAHFEGPHLYLLYPSDPSTEAATMREAMLCQREGIVINIFLLQSWSQSHEDIRFAHRLAETTKGRVFFTAGRDLDRFVVWDYVNRRKSIIG